MEIWMFEVEDEHGTFGGQMAVPCVTEDLALDFAIRYFKRVTKIPFKFSFKKLFEEYKYEITKREFLTKLQSHGQDAYEADGKQGRFFINITKMPVIESIP